MKMDQSNNIDLEVINQNKIDWDELMPDTPKYYKINPLQFLLLIIIIIAGIYFIGAAMLSLWDGGTQ